MLGIILLLISIILYVKGNKKWSILLFISFCGDGFMLLTDNVIGFKNQDAAFLYLVIILLYSHLYEKKTIYVHNPKIEKWLKVFFIFMILNILFSLFFYKLNMIQILQGGRRYLIIFSFFFIRKIKTYDIEWILSQIVHITTITSILYIIQCQTGLPVLPDGDIYYSNDSVDGTFRYYNAPTFLTLSMLLLLFYPKYYKGWKNSTAILIMFVALLSTQTRTFIAGMIMVILVGFYINGSYKKTVKYLLLGAIVITPFIPILTERFDNGDKSTSGDLQAILAGEFMKNNIAYSGTMSFRFALVYERAHYLTERSIGEQVFGMGLLSDQQKALVRKMYNFKVGLRGENGHVTQLSSPDIAYANLICRLGFVGMTIYLIIWGIIMAQAYKCRKQHLIVLCLFLNLCGMFIMSFSSATISYTESIILPMMLLVFKDRIKLSKNTLHENRK